MKTKTDVIFGVNPVMEKLRASPDEVVEILLADGHLRSSLRAIEVEARRLGVRLTYAHHKALDRLAASDKHQGVIAKVAPYLYSQFFDWFQSDSPSSSSDGILVLDGLTDPRNFGALLRTAEAVGVRRIIIPQDRSVEVTPTVVKASAGAVHHLQICRITNLRRAMLTLKENGYWLVGLDDQASEQIYDRIYPEKLGIILGSEGRGIRPLILRECDYRVSIPMLGKISSLNVAVAGAVFLYEILRQKRSIDKKAPKG
ncbi:MAG: 23S rRNA (guanosine(2251)-2'-O)-methyltransferase RlmB [Deltaproteobacteria bacterium]